VNSKNAENNKMCYITKENAVSGFHRGVKKYAIFGIYAVFDRLNVEDDRTHRMLGNVDRNYHSTVRKIPKVLNKEIVYTTVT
jgi:hypothetical protein